MRWLEFAQDIAAGASEEERAAFFAGTANRIYRPVAG